MADNLTNKTFPNDDMDDTKMTQGSGGNTNASQNLSNEDRSKGGKASSSQQDMNKLGQMGGDKEKSEGDNH